MQRLVKDMELQGRSKGIAPVVDLTFLTVFMKVVVYAITQRTLELDVEKMKLQVWLLQICLLQVCSSMRTANV